MSVVGLTPTGQQRATETARRVLGSGSSETRNRRKDHARTGDRYCGVLTSTLAAGSLSVPSTATIRVYLPDPSSSSEPVPFIAAEEDGEDFELTLVNRDESLAADPGVFVKVEYLHGEWSPYWVGCPVD